MFESVEENRKTGFVAKVLAFSAVGLCVSAGLCGAAGEIDSHLGSTLSGIFMGAGVLVLGLSLLGLLVGFFGLVVAFLDGMRGGRD